jgi:hypothetical protein
MQATASGDQAMPTTASYMGNKSSEQPPILGITLLFEDDNNRSRRRRDANDGINYRVTGLGMFTFLGRRIHGNIG